MYQHGPRVQWKQGSASSRRPLLLRAPGDGERSKRQKVAPTTLSNVEATSHKRGLFSSNELKHNIKWENPAPRLRQPHSLQRVFPSRRQGQAGGTLWSPPIQSPAFHSPHPPSASRQQRLESSGSERKGLSWNGRLFNDLGIRKKEALLAWRPAPKEVIHCLF